MSRWILPALFFAAPLAAQDVNLALGGTATQSTTTNNAPAGLAVDGIRDGVFTHGSVTHTANAPGAWWQVQFPTNTFHEIVIYNRADCCGQRLSNFRVEALVSGTAIFSQDYFTAGGSVPQGQSLHVLMPSTGAPADTIRISLLGPGASGEEVLSLTEVEVLQYGMIPEVNIAPFGIATQSSTGSNGAARRAIDGNPDGYWGNGSVSHTTNAPGSWWQVDLRWRSQIDVIRLYNRTDCCSGRLSNFRLSVFDGATEVFGQDFYTAGGNVPVSVPEIVTLPAMTMGDRVRVAGLGPGSSNEEIISLAEVEVLRQGLPASYGPFGAGCAGSMGVPMLFAVPPNVPAVGTSFVVRIAPVPALPGLAYLAFGLSKSTWMGNPLPFDLAGLGAPGCQVLTSGEGGLFIGATGNTANLTVAVPNLRALIGTTIYHQALVLDAAASNALGAVVSNAAEMVLGM